jgi:aminoglycoside phosphotransferase (APT) family kinase protein
VPADALAAACAAVGLDSSGAEIIYQRANTVYKLASAPVVARLRYTRGSAALLERLSASVQATRWLDEVGFPAVRPVDVPQPVPAHGYLVTFWHYLPSDSPGRRDIEALARLLRQLHGLPPPPVRLPDTAPLGSVRADAAACLWLTDSQRGWLTARCDELEGQYAGAESALGYGLVHGDAHAGNLIHGQGRVVLCDWDAVSYGPREQDLIPVRLGYRYGRADEWEELCRFYPVDLGTLPLLPLLERMRELRAVAAYLRLEDLPQARAEASHRIGDLMSGTQREPWRALNLA